MPCKERAERWETDANYADVDFDYGPETGVYVVFGEASVKVDKNVWRGGMLMSRDFEGRKNTYKSYLGCLRLSVRRTA